MEIVIVITNMKQCSGLKKKSTRILKPSKCKNIRKFKHFYSFFFGRLSVSFFVLFFGGVVLSGLAMLVSA